MLSLAIARESIINYAYLVAAVMFIVGLMRLSQVKTARQGNLISALGMLVATVATLFVITGGQAISLIWIALALAIGSVVGLMLAIKVPMTGMPQMVALLNGFGGLASLLVACGDYATKAGHDALATAPGHMLLATGLTVFVGAITFTGSVVAFGKLQGGPFWKKWTPGNPVQFPGQKAAIAAGIVLCLLMTGLLTANESWGWTIILNTLIALVLGYLLVIGIGGADMPVVISLLNSYSGIAAAFAGFVLNNQALIITGALVGASGIILTQIMCKAMNRSLMNVLFGGVGVESGPAAGADGAAAAGPVKELTAEDAAIVIEAAQQVVVVPGYGMAVAQAQHACKELADKLEAKGIKVLYGIHPVAGRMPGHMNVLLAEANVPYDNLCDLDTINPQFEQTDVVLVIGANDVTNPAARHAKSSPIYGMPILDVDKARNVIVIKRSLNPGFAGIENELYYRPNCSMLFGDAKKALTELAAAVDAL